MVWGGHGLERSLLDHRVGSPRKDVLVEIEMIAYDSCGG